MPPLTAWSRREFLGAAAAFPLAVKSMAEPQAPNHIFVGTQDGEGIYRHTWNPATGELGAPELAIATDRPNYFALHPTLPVLYSTNEREQEKATISAFHIGPNATLDLLNIEQTHSDDPCFVSIDHTGRLVFAANYSGGSLTTFPVHPGGKLGPRLALFDGNHAPLRGQPGPVKARQEASHFHCAFVSPKNTTVVACDLGTDSIFLFPIDPAAHTLGKPQRIPTRPGSGPRHVAFHPNGKWLYCIHEVDCTVDLFDMHENTALTLTPRDHSAVSTLPPGQSLKDQTACEVLVSGDGRFLHLCTRGIDQLVSYTIDPHTGLLTEFHRQSCGGVNPRLITFDPTGRWLLCANQNSPFVTVFAYDAQTGRFSDSAKKYEANSPMCFAFV